MFQTDTTNRRWTLTQGAFDRFLAKLDPDRENAGRAYVQLREYLIRSFQTQAPLDAEYWADTVLDRVARKNEEIEIANVTAFACGVARLVRAEACRANRRHVTLDKHAELQQVPKNDEEIDQARQSEKVNRAVRRLPESDVKLLLSWYSSCAKASQRQQLATTLGVSVTWLRVRAHRARVRVRQMALADEK